MTQDKADMIFDSSLGQRLDMVYVTSDDRVFIRFEEAFKHTNGELDGTKPLENKEIEEWFPSWA